MENRKPELIRLISGFVLFLLSFIFSQFSLFFLIASYLVLGFPVFKRTFSNLLHGTVFDENFLMTVATVGAFILKDYREAVFVMLFYCVGETAQDMAVDRSEENIASLMEIAPEKALLLENGTVKEVLPQNVAIGDIIKVLPGERIPLDGVIVKGSGSLDTSALTGESIPLQVSENTTVLSGSIVLDSPLLIKVTDTYDDSTVSKIIKLVRDSQKTKAPTEKFMTKFAKIYTPIVCSVAVLIAIIPSLITGNWDIWVSRALNCLVISCPCALVLSIPLAFFAGIGGSAKKGILLKGGNVIEKLSESSIIAFDKTGTLTKGNLEVTSFKNLSSRSDSEILSYCLTLESQSNHPIAKSICKYCQENSAVMLSVLNPLEVKGKGISGTVKKKTLRIGNMDYVSGLGTVDSDIFLADEKQLLASFSLGDSVKDEALSSLKELRKLGIRKAVVISGDSEQAVSKVSSSLKLDEHYSRQLPQQKVEILSKLMSDGTCVYVGDGINDAPCLVKADVGISMGQIGSDVAVEASDAVIMTDELSKIPLALKIAKKTMMIARQNILFALSVKCACLALGILGITGMLVATVSDTGVAFLCVLNSMRALSNK